MGGGRLQEVVVHGGSTALTVVGPDLQIRVGGGAGHPNREITGGCKNKGEPGPPGPFPGSATDSNLAPRVLSYPSRENLGTRLL